MRIIDKNQDFYDYLQSPTDSIVFDRRGSFLLTKQMVCKEAGSMLAHKCDEDFRFLLLQCGATFWLFLLTITKTDGHAICSVLDYDLELLISWKDYSAERVPIGLYLVTFPLWYMPFFPGRVSAKEIIRKRANELKDAYIHKEYNDKRDIGVMHVHVDYKGDWTHKTLTIPLLKACGISAFLDPVEVFSAIEEHFSMKKTEAEKTEPEGATNNDKIIMHGFDTKTSFRGR